MSVNIGINIQRSPNRINQQLREAGVEGKFPKLLLDFKDQYYLANGGSKTLASAITHVRSGNATMTDGYGPELVVNNGFDSDSDWTKGTGWTISDGKARSAATTYQTISQSLSNTAGIYEVRVQASGNTNSDGRLVVDLDGDQYLSGYGSEANGSFVAYLEASANATLAFGASTRATARFNGTIDSVSVREMPVLKWAPHNLVSYSEDFTALSWRNVASTRTADQAEAPNGTNTADLFVPNATSTWHGFDLASGGVSVTSGISYTYSIYVKANGYNWVQIGGSTPAFAGTYANVNLSDGSTGNSSGITATVTDVGNDWYKISVTATAVSNNSNGSFFFAIYNSDVGSRLPSFSGNGTSGIYVWGAHVYRSDLGGMVDNPDQPLSRASYVPTTSAAKYLPRIGHHVYNGSAWANEGLLAESEARTNLVDYSDILNAQWLKVSSTITDNDAVSPDGTENAARINETTSNASHYFYDSGLSFTSGQNYTFSIYVKPDTATVVQLVGIASAFGLNFWVNFDLSSGTVSSSGSATVASTIEDAGNGWYRISATGACVSTVSSVTGLILAFTNNNASAGRFSSYVGDTAQQFYAYGAQVELGSTPSSLITTSGSSVTRAAESFTIPSANLPWPDPVYIGSQLVTNGTFDTDSDWTLGTNWSITGGQLEAASTPQYSFARQTLTTVVGNVYEATVDCTSYTSGNYRLYVHDGSSYQEFVNFNSTGTYTFRWVAHTTSDQIRVYSYGVTNVASFDNVSVRELAHPLSVSIATEGRVTFADTNDATEVEPFNWAEGSSNRIKTELSTSGSFTGRMAWIQTEGGVGDVVVEAGNGSFAPDILVPFDIASRHGSTFINGATDGIALTANTTPTALPDLSATDLDLAYDYMGTLATFRVWDRDITDDGLVEATNPSLEPSLSLEFSGLGTNSFVIADWSE